MNSKRISAAKIKGSAILAISMSVMLCLFEPLQIYFTNIEDFWYDIYNLLPACLILTLCMFAGSMLFFLLTMVIHEKVWKIGSLLYGITLVCTYIQGNYLAGNLPAIDGNFQPWSLYDYQRKYCIILWAVVILLTGAAVYKKGTEFAIKIHQYIALFLLGIFLVTGTVTCLTNDGFMDKGDLTVTTKDFFTLSKEGTNFIILMMDSVRGGELNELLEQDEGYNEIFKDFTCYRDTMTAYPMTNYSIYYMLSGDWFEGDQIINDYRRDVLLSSPFFAELEKRDFAMQLYMVVLPFFDNDGFYRFGNFVRQQSHFTSFLSFAKLELRLVGLKYAPYDLKRRCMALPEEIDNLRESETVDNLYDCENPIFVDLMRNTPIEYSDRNEFKFYEVDGAHTPFYFNRNLEETDQELDYSEEIRACLNMSDEYIQRLKEAGCYDNSIIVILSDHGFNPDPVGDIADIWNPKNRQHGMLFIKGIDEHHDTLQYSDAPIHHGDLQEAYLNLLEHKESGEVFSVKEGDVRERRFLLHTSVDTNHLWEYIQRGKADDMSTMEATGRMYLAPYGLMEGDQVLPAP